jgi:hypothetical protein
MNPDTIELFRRLADRSPSEREAYYVQHRVPRALRREVESLLCFDGETNGAIQGRVAAAARAAAKRAAPPATAASNGR